MSQREVYEYITNHPDSTAREIATGLGCKANDSRTRVQNALTRLMIYGEITRWIDLEDPYKSYRYRVKE